MVIYFFFFLVFLENLQSVFEKKNTISQYDDFVQKKKNSNNMMA